MKPALSKFFSKRPKLLFSIYETLMNIGLKIDMKDALISARRPEWLYSNITPSFIHPIYYSQPDVVNDTSLVLATRIIDAYAAVKDEMANPNNSLDQSSLWAIITLIHLSQLAQILDSKDPEKLSEHLSIAFQRDFVLGYAAGTTYQKLPHRLQFVSMGILSQITYFAEELGIIPVESCEQGVIGRQFKVGVNNLVKEIEDHLNINLDFPRIGGAYGVLHNNRLFTGESMLHVHSAFHILQALNRHKDKIQGPLNILEIGGGYGGTAYWMHKILGDRIASYTLIDIPGTNVMQSYFLSKALPEREIVLFKEKPTSTKKKIFIHPHFDLDNITGRGINLVINQDSMPEMPEVEVNKYLNWIEKNVSGLFSSYNQEAAQIFNGKPQIIVPDLVKKYPKMVRLERQLSLIRRGYVEEVYQVN